MHSTISKPTNSHRHVSAGGNVPPTDEHHALRSLVGPVLVALRRANLNKLHRALAMDLVEASFNARPGALRFVFVVNYSQFGRLGLSSSQVADVLNGRNSDSGWIAGLTELNIVSKKEFAGGGVVLAVNPDWSRWGCQWIYSAADKAGWLADVSAQSREVVRQLEAEEIKERFSLATLLPAVDVENALRLVVDERGALAGGHRMRDVVARGDAPLVAEGTGARSAAGVARGLVAPVVGNVAGDAPLVRPKRMERSCAAPRSEIANAICKEKRGSFGNREPSRARAALSSGTKSSTSALTLSVEQLKDLIRSGRENDFVKAMQAIIPTHENGDGGKWRSKWRVPELKPSVVAMFEAIIERIAEGTLRRTAALEAHWYWQDFGGAAAEENLRNLLTTQ